MVTRIPKCPEEILFLCNKKKCEKCSYPECKHTTDKKYALHPAIEEKVNCPDYRDYFDIIQGHNNKNKLVRALYEKEK